MSATSQAIAERAARIATLVEMCEDKACSTAEIAAALNVIPKRINDYTKPLVDSGKLFKWRIVANGVSAVFYASSLEEAKRAAEHLADSAVHIVRKTWTGKPPAMFAPMAYLFGRVPC